MKFDAYELSEATAFLGPFYFSAFIIYTRWFYSLKKSFLLRIIGWRLGRGELSSFFLLFIFFLDELTSTKKKDKQVLCCWFRCWWRCNCVFSWLLNLHYKINYCRWYVSPHVVAVEDYKRPNHCSSGQ